jgi:antitoxin component YwqK of YwqJK toxin-antitoxin module
MRNGMYHGKGKQYDMNSIMRCIGEFKDGVRNGTCACYDQSGYFTCEGEIRNGVIDDDFVYFCVENEPKYFGQFKNSRFVNGVEFSLKNKTVKIYQVKYDANKE